TTGLTDSLFDFIEGTVSAKEAFEDFARSTLRWLGEIIVKQQLSNWLFGATGTGGLIGGFLSHGGKGPGELGIPRVMNPEVFKNARRFHSGKMPGIRDDEIPAVIQKNETVFTPGQLRQFASMMGGSGKSVNINNNFAGSYFMDAQLLAQSMRIIAAQVTASLAPNVMVTAFKNDHPIRGIMRGGM
ncbi:MAG: hypothetical protein KKD77_23580, partial [Gammaproteobacteria bacterium]|nr:hypothetical protein [Gammaproteobacteria bacterium]